MKKLAAISLVLAMTAASLAGCGSTANTAAPAESEAAETPAATTEETTDTAADTVAADRARHVQMSCFFLLNLSIIFMFD